MSVGQKPCETENKKNKQYENNESKISSGRRRVCPGPHFWNRSLRRKGRRNTPPPDSRRRTGKSRARPGRGPQMCQLHRHTRESGRQGHQRPEPCRVESGQTQLHRLLDHRQHSRHRQSSETSCHAQLRRRCQGRLLRQQLTFPGRHILGPKLLGFGPIFLRPGPLQQKPQICSCRNVVRHAPAGPPRWNPGIRY